MEADAAVSVDVRARYVSEVLPSEQRVGHGR